MVQQFVMFSLSPEKGKKACIASESLLQSLSTAKEKKAGMLNKICGFLFCKVYLLQSLSFKFSLLQSLS